MGGVLHGPWQHPWPWMRMAPRTSPQVVALGPAPSRAEPQDRSELLIGGFQTTYDDADLCTCLTCHGRDADCLS